jgi:pseudouridine-5'-phosphate glycosidase
MTFFQTNMNNSNRYSLLPAVAQAMQTGRGVVALESTVIAHGLPAPHNLETASACEQAVLASGAQPATIGILAGRATVGLTAEEVAELASRSDVAKVNLANLGTLGSDDGGLDDVLRPTREHQGFRDWWHRWRASRRER